MDKVGVKAERGYPGPTRGKIDSEGLPASAWYKKLSYGERTTRCAMSVKSCQMLHSCRKIHRVWQ